MEKKLKIVISMSLLITFSSVSNVFAASVKKGSRNLKLAAYSQMKKGIKTAEAETHYNEAIPGSGFINAKEGDKLSDPEGSWTRYDDSNSKIIYKGNWTTLNYGGDNNWDKQYQGTNSLDASIVFCFKGTKLRLISSMSDYCSNNIIVTIDGKKDYFNEGNNSDGASWKMLAYQKDGLEDKIHTVKISMAPNETKPIDNKKNGENNYWMELDAVDIDTTGALEDLPTVNLDKTEDSILKDQTEQLVATVNPEDLANKDLDWVSSDPSIATVDESGKVTGVKSGNTTITATTKDGSNISVTCKLAVDDYWTGTTLGNATVKNKLDQPEKGWIRYDDSNSRILHNGNFETLELGGKENCGGSYQGTHSKDASIVFSFKGTKLRLISSMSNYCSDGIMVTIDGKSEYFDEGNNSDTALWQMLVYQKDGLEDTIHTVKISMDPVKTQPTTNKTVAPNNYWMELDAIDVGLDAGQTPQDLPETNLN